MTWKAGDWCFFEFELGRVKDTQAGPGPTEVRVTEVRKAYTGHGGWDLSNRCFPLTVDNMAHSEHFRHYYDQLHREGPVGLNYPKIHDWMVTEWSKACRGEDHESPSKFTDWILAAVKGETPFGFPLMRPRSG